VSLQELKDKSPTDLVAYAEALEIENASSLRKQDMLFAILKTLADEGTEIIGSGVLEVLQDGFGFLRSPEANYLPGPGRHLRLSVAAEAHGRAHRRQHRGADPLARVRRAVFAPC
jgi:transcription termination factor Rho